MHNGASQAADSLLAEIAALLAKDDIETATRRAEAAMAVPSQQAHAICALAALYYRAGALANAITLLLDVVDRDDAPKDTAEVLAVLYCLAGQVTNALYYGKLSTGIGAEDALLELFGPDFPKFADAFGAIGYKPLMARASVALSEGETERAILLLKQQLLLDSTDVEALDFYAQALTQAGDLRGAIGILRSVATLATPTATILSRLGHCLTLVGELDQGEACHLGAVARSPKSPVILSAMLADLRYREADLPLTARIAEQWAAAIAASGPKTVRAAPAYTGTGPIRIGYLVTSDLGDDVAGMLTRMLRGHDRSRFTVMGLGAGEPDDDRNAWARGVFDSWRDVGALDVATLSAVIRGEGIHVLVDMDGLAKPDHSGLFLRNSAALQVSWLNTSPVGRAPGNYRLCVAGNGAGDGELGLPYGRWFLGGAPMVAAQTSPSPAAAGTGPTFGCELTPAQLTPQLAMTFGRILHAVPDATLLVRDTGGLADPVCVDRMIELLGNAAIAHRVDVVQGDDRATFSRAVDVVLAPFPAGDVLACGEMLRLGVPVVVAANNADGRDLAAVMASLGLSELVAEDVDAYVATASALGLDTARLASLRAELPERVAASPAFTAREFVAPFEAAILEALTGNAA